MPTSYYQTVPAIVSMVLAENPSSILDLGIGFGKYGVLCREALDIPYERYQRDHWRVRIDGVEGYSGYRNPIHDYVYNEVRYGKIEVVLDQVGVYDVVLLIDVLEHFAKEEGEALLRRILHHTRKALIVSTPVAPAHQEQYMGNTLEHHLSVWQPEDFIRLGGEAGVLPIGGDGAILATLRPSPADRLHQIELGAPLGEKVAAAVEALEAGVVEAADMLVAWYNSRPDGFPTAGLHALANEAKREGDYESAGALLLQAFYQQPSLHTARHLLAFTRMHATDKHRAVRTIVAERFGEPPELADVM